MVQLYIQYTDGNYYLLDLEETETINFKLTVKDLSDITKIFAPFTQSFSLKATDKNKMLCGFIGNEKIQQINNTREFNAKIYIAGFLFQSGVLKFKETNYELKEQKSFKTNFASNLTGISERLGDLKIQDLFDLTDPMLSLNWSTLNLKSRMTSVQSGTMANGVVLKVGIPFISNNRIWGWNEDNLNIIDNIAYNKTVLDTNKIELTEVRPAISYMTIMNHLLLKIGSPVICPLFDKSVVNDLYAWCNSENLVLPKVLSYPLFNYSALSYSRYDTKDEIVGISVPTSPKWEITVEQISGVFKIKRDTNAYRPSDWSDGFDINFTFDNLIALEGNTTKIKVVLKNATNGIEIDSKEIDNNVYTFRVLDPFSGASMLDTNGELFVKFEILPITLAKWDTITVQTVQKFRVDRKVALAGKRVTRASFSATSTNNTSSAALGGNKINLISTLPDMKCIDFLKSFFLTFNISVISTGKEDNSMYWLTPSDIQETNKEYSKRIVDYTKFTDVATVNKKETNEYNQYLFSHANSKYYESLFGDGTAFGSLAYPATITGKPNKFEVKTSYSILKQANTFVHPSTVKSCLAFERDNAEILPNGAVRYKPVFGEFTLFYLKPKDLNFNTLSVQNTPAENAELFGVLEATYKDPSSGKTLAFGGNEFDFDSLYLNYYKDLIEKLLKPNTFLSEFSLVLPANEIFLNFANINQGESNIPTGFRAQNEIIIGEQRYELSDATIDLTTGKTKLTLLNF